MQTRSQAVSFVIVGGSGDLARRKIAPALFALFCAGRLPPAFRLVGYGRTPLSDDAFRGRLREHLTCRAPDAARCSRRTAEFLARCCYQPGAYESVDAYLDLFQRLRAQEGDLPANRVFYMAVPPEAFAAVARALGSAGLAACGRAPAWARVVVEKPFGYDRASSDRLAGEMGQVFAERDTYRIDHYLGKELVQNLLVLRFANRVFEPLWNRRHVRAVRIVWREDAGLAGRAGYFDRAGIVRDVVQNHLLQILALVAMEPPARLDGPAVADAKTRVLRAVAPPGLADAVLGQYAAGLRAGAAAAAYRDEPGVAPASRTPTYAAIRLAVNTPRWKGIPFLVEAGKGLHERMSEVRIAFRPARGPAPAGSGEPLVPNELVVRIQPDEAIRLRVLGKPPGLGMTVAPAELNLLYRERFGGELPDAYERLLLDVLAGDRTLFIRNDELAAAWDVVTPLLHAWDASAQAPVPYPLGGQGPGGGAG